jgi:methionyl-tRNA formyltransferase
MSMLDRLLFFGTPDFAVPTLEALCAAGREPVLVVAQPARPVGREQALEDPPVARAARRLGLPLAQPERVKHPDFLEALRALAPDLAVVAAFGQIFPRELLDLPRHGCINLHASLLPRWRGAAPIQAAIAAGDATTGVTTMRMEAGLDTGPILLQEETAIAARETAGKLSARLATLGAELTVRTLAALERAEVTPRPQPVEGVTYAPRLTRQSGRIDWRSTAQEVARRLRAFTPWPGVATEMRGAPVKILAGDALPGSAEAIPGTPLGLVDGTLAVACGGGTRFGVQRLQKAGKRAVDAASFVHGERLQPGERFV